MAERAYFSKRRSSHTPYDNLLERRLVHTTVAEYDDIATESIGDRAF